MSRAPKRIWWCEGKGAMDKSPRKCIFRIGSKVPEAEEDLCRKCTAIPFVPERKEKRG